MDIWWGNWMKFGYGRCNAAEGLCTSHLPTQFPQAKVSFSNVIACICPAIEAISGCRPSPQDPVPGCFLSSRSKASLGPKTWTKLQLACDRKDWFGVRRCVEDFQVVHCSERDWRNAFMSCENYFLWGWELAVESFKPEFGSADQLRYSLHWRWSDCAGQRCWAGLSP